MGGRRGFAHTHGRISISFSLSNHSRRTIRKKRVASVEEISRPFPPSSFSSPATFRAWTSLPPGEHTGERRPSPCRDFDRDLPASCRRRGVHLRRNGRRRRHRRNAVSNRETKVNQSLVAFSRDAPRIRGMRLKGDLA